MLPANHGEAVKKATAVLSHFLERDTIHRSRALRNLHITQQLKPKIMTKLTILCLLTLATRIEAWCSSSFQKRRTSLLSLQFKDNKEQEDIIDVEYSRSSFSTSDSIQEEESQKRNMRKNEIFIPLTLFSSPFQQRGDTVYYEPSTNFSPQSCDQLSSDQQNGEIKIMQWEKQIGDTIRKGETILLVEGEDSLMGASSNLRVLKELISDQDGILRDIKVPSGLVDFHTPLGILEPMDILDVELENDTECSSSTAMPRQVQEEAFRKQALLEEQYSAREQKQRRHHPKPNWYEMKAQFQKHEDGDVSGDTRVKKASSKVKPTATEETASAADYHQIKANAKLETLDARKHAELEEFTELAKQQTRKAKEDAQRSLQATLKEIRLDTQMQIEKEREQIRLDAQEEITKLKEKMQFALEQESYQIKQLAEQELQYLKHQAEQETQTVRIQLLEQQAQEQEIVKFQAQVEEARRIELARIEAQQQGLQECASFHDEPNAGKDDYREGTACRNKSSTQRHSLFY
jgi:hypothetical protein